jgi:hypothetical protein
MMNYRALEWHSRGRQFELASNSLSTIIKPFIYSCKLRSLIYQKATLLG